jgi:RimJ/RimL family protein N-acetyltransferase/ribosomal protein S18 acetylase RimI-like enzyme
VAAERIHRFRRRLEAEVSSRVVATANGRAFLADSIPEVYDCNYLSVDAPSVSARELAAEADEALADRHHRRVVVENGAPGLASELGELGYDLSTHLVLARTREPDRTVDTSAIREVELEELESARTEATLREPWGDAALAVQLNEAKRLVARAVPTRFFAAVVADEIAGWCEVRAWEETAQIEDVEVRDTYRGRGLGRALVQHALVEAGRWCDVVFLEALADDWPRELYAKLGFTIVGRRELYTRLPPVVTRLRLRTPRLELRYPTIAELRELFRVAEAGIHDPAEMPFGVAWTDDLDQEAFVAFHRSKQTVRPDEWDLQLVALHHGTPIGSQSVGAESFVRDRTVVTGSWLGREWQGRGLGTEMRAAVLVLAFERLGAHVAQSGAIAGNPQSLGVSRKLGYEIVGSHEVSPRGVPVEHADLELRRERFRSPVAVEITGLDQLLPLLGAQTVDAGWPAA